MTYLKKLDYENRGDFMIGVHSREGLGTEHVTMQTGTDAGPTAYGVANMAIYVPIRIARDFTVESAWVAMGTASGNIQFGLYSEAGTRLANTASTAASGTFQTIALAYTLPGPARYYMAFWCSNTTATFYRSGINTGQILAGFGVAQETGLASGLGTTATFAKYSSANCLPMFGISGKTSL